jgi:hypothetical protein
LSSVVHQLRWARGDKSASNTNRIFDIVAGGWDLNTIVTASSGTPRDMIYSPPTANEVTGPMTDYRGVAQLRPNVSGRAARQSTSQIVDSYFAV